MFRKTEKCRCVNILAPRCPSVSTYKLKTPCINYIKGSECLQFCNIKGWNAMI